MEKMIFYSWGQPAVDHTLPPKTAQKEIAKYWKDLPAYHNPDAKKLIDESKGTRFNLHQSLKHCMPYFDAMTMAYHYLLHTDITVVRMQNNFADIKHNSPISPVSPRQLKEMPTPHGHYDAHWSWQMYWGIKPPAGYSVLVTHPLNRYDLPFTTTSGLADYDVYPMPGNVSFHIKDNFEGVIPAGTPIMSLIPIKRENWESEIITSEEFYQEMFKFQIEKEQFPMAHYKKNYRVDKDYK